MSAVAELFDALSLAPSLPGAKCKGRAELFDAAVAGRALPRVQVTQAQARAIALCRSCPALQGCISWVDSLEPWQRPSGVVAGRLNVTSRNPSGHFSTPKTPLGRRLRELREERQWHQGDLARAAGTWASRISDWEVGRSRPSPPALQRIATAFGMSVAEILTDIM